MNKTILIIAGAIAAVFFFRRNGGSSNPAPAPAQPNDPFSFNLGRLGRITLPRGAVAADAPAYTWNPFANQNQSVNPITNPQGRAQPVSTQATTGGQIALIGNASANLIKSLAGLFPAQRARNELPPYAQTILGPGDELYSYATGPNGAFYRPDRGTIPVPAPDPVMSYDLPPTGVGSPEIDATGFGFDWTD